MGFSWYMTYTKKHRGVTFSAQTEESLAWAIKNSDFERTVFHRKSGFGRSSYARMLDDGRVEFISLSHVEDERTTKIFDSKKDYYNC